MFTNLAILGAPPCTVLAKLTQDGAPKIAKLPYKWLNYVLW